MTDKKEEGSLWDIAIVNRNNVEKAITSGDSKDEKHQLSEESSIFIMGSKGSGKSTIILRFLDKDETPKPTVALDYTFGRRVKGHNLNKDIGHIWELGGGTNLSKLIDVPLTAETIGSTAICLILDLSKPNELWYTMEVLLKATRSTIDKLLAEMKKEDPKLVQEIQDNAWKRFGEGHQDKTFLEPFPIPIGIIGTKYDIYQDFDPEKRKMISRTLRFIAHSNGAHLQYFSSKAEGLVNRTRGLFSSLLFHTSVSKAVSTDHNKPMLVPAGQDNFSNIGTPPVPNENLAKLTGRRPYDLWKNAYESVFPPENTQGPQKGEDITHNPQYAESVIDNVRAQKDEVVGNMKREQHRSRTRNATMFLLQELVRYKKEAERKAKTAARANKAKQIK